MEAPEKIEMRWLRKLRRCLQEFFCSAFLTAATTRSRSLMSKAVVCVDTLSRPRIHPVSKSRGRLRMCRVFQYTVAPWCAPELKTALLLVLFLLLPCHYPQMLVGHFQTVLKWFLILMSSFFFLPRAPASDCVWPRFTVYFETVYKSFAGSDTGASQVPVSRYHDNVEIIWHLK